MTGATRQERVTALIEEYASCRHQRPALETALVEASIAVARIKDKRQGLTGEDWDLLKSAIYEADAAFERVVANYRRELALRAAAGVLAEQMGQDETS